MKNEFTAHPRAIALLLAAVALPTTPLMAQEAPPPVAPTVAAPAPAPEAAPAPAAPAAQAPVFAPRQEVVQPLPPRPAPPPEAVEEAAQVAAAPVRRVARPAVTRTPAAPVAAAPVAAVTPAVPAPVAAAPAVPEAAPAPVPAPETAPAVSTDATATTTETTTSITPWMWIGLGIVALAALALVFLRRKRRDEDVYYEEPAVVERAVVAAPVAAPVATAPVRTTPVSTAPVTKPVAKATKKTPVSDDERPWIGLSVWPKEAGNGTLQYDLVVENVGDVEAHDVRVSSLIIDGAKSTPMESSLIEDGETRSIDISAGHSIPIAQTIAVEDGKAPHILAEARYPLPGGGEGHIAARFALDTAEDGSVEARLDDLLERV